MLKLARVFLLTVAVLNAGCFLCIFDGCCMMNPHQGMTGSTYQDMSQHRGCGGEKHVNLDWMTFDPEPTLNIAVKAFLPPRAKLEVPWADLAVYSPPPQASLFS